MKKLFIILSLFGMVYAGCYGPPVATRRKIVYVSLYNPSTVLTLTGIIVGVKYVFVDDFGEVLVLKVKTPGGIFFVHTGPRHWIIKRGWIFRPGMRVIIAGSRGFYSGKKVIFASQVNSGKKVIFIRDKKGKPLWKIYKKKGKGKGHW